MDCCLLVVVFVASRVIRVLERDSKDADVKPRHVFFFESHLYLVQYPVF